MASVSSFPGTPRKKPKKENEGEEQVNYGVLCRTFDIPTWESLDSMEKNARKTARRKLKVLPGILSKDRSSLGHREYWVHVSSAGFHACLVHLSRNTQEKSQKELNELADESSPVLRFAELDMERLTKFIYKQCMQPYLLSYEWVIRDLSLVLSPYICCCSDIPVMHRTCE